MQGGAATVLLALAEATTTAQAQQQQAGPLGLAHGAQAAHAPPQAASIKMEVEQHRLGACTGPAMDIDIDMAALAATIPPMQPQPLLEAARPLLAQLTASLNTCWEQRPQPQPQPQPSLHAWQVGQGASPGAASAGDTASALQEAMLIGAQLGHAQALSQLLTALQEHALRAACARGCAGAGPQRTGAMLPCTAPCRHCLGTAR